MSKIISTALKAKAPTPYRPLTQQEYDFITQCFKLGMSARSVAPMVPCSCNTCWKCYQRLKKGEVLTPYLAGRKPKEKRLPGTVGATSKLIEKWERKKSNKPLINEARFYKSTFEPA